MEKRTLICSCGQEMMVPSSALGRRGLCPNCGKEVQITEENTHAHDPQRPRGSGLLGRRAVARKTEVPREEASRRFATAVDLYNAQRYAEALIVLDALLNDFPNNTHIDAARNQCLESLRGPGESPALTYEEQPVDETRLSLDLVKSVVLEKLVHGSSDEVQLKAAELALQVLAQDEQRKAEPAAALPAVLPYSNGRNGHDRNPKQAAEPPPVIELTEPTAKPKPKPKRKPKPKPRRKATPRKRKT